MMYSTLRCVFPPDKSRNLRAMYSVLHIMALLCQAPLCQRTQIYFQALTFIDWLLSVGRQLGS